MIQEIYFNQFCDAFRDMGRDNNFSCAGKQALFDYLEEYEEITDEKINLDIICLCCDYSEYKNLKELQQNYTNIESMEDLEDHTQVIKIEGSEGFIIQDF